MRFLKVIRNFLKFSRKFPSKVFFYKPKLNVSNSVHPKIILTLLAKITLTLLNKITLTLLNKIT